MSAAQICSNPNQNTKQAAKNIVDLDSRSIEKDFGKIDRFASEYIFK